MRKVLILGEDLLFAGTLKLELQRDPRMDVRYASWGPDAAIMVNHYGANLFVVDLTPSKAVPDEVLAAVCSQRASARGAAVAYYAMADEELDAHPLVRSRLASLCPDAALPKAKGLRALTIEYAKRCETLKREAVEMLLVALEILLEPGVADANSATVALDADTKLVPTWLV